ncbi:unnamed protein product [Acanthoscelides obtectus]|uniref:Uncharacterized protein n=1 Tax=Acanthoscelides obtectus TaxID=200917 RepID=A0A9P0PV39_ACAOB|nr:unnamed protein product [Acanthoscelides obtectus]CAK1651416.1 hypothetical protein AOBTE_LOCUS17255 [Acanthoscelides obtectus]
MSAVLSTICALSLTTIRVVESGKKRQFLSLKKCKQLLPISEMTKRDLEKLCKNNVIPARFHEEFFKLKCKSSLPEDLAETDAEDDKIKAPKLKKIYIFY